MVTPRRLAAALSSLSAVLVVVPVAIVAVVIGPSSFCCVVLPLTCARCGAKKKGRLERTRRPLWMGMCGESRRPYRR